MMGTVAGREYSTIPQRLGRVAAVGCLLMAAGVIMLATALVVVIRTSDWPSTLGREAELARAAAAQAIADVDNSPSGGTEHVPAAVAGGAAAALPAAADGPFTADGPMQLVIESIGVDAPIEPVGLIEVQVDGRDYRQWQVPDGYAVGWHRTSARVGQAGNTVLNGHNNVHGAVFRDLADLGYGDEIAIYSGQVVHRYRVAHRVLLEENDQPLGVRLDNARWMLPTTDERLTLISCWPYVGNSQRLILIAVPMDGR